jgi:hypothetical protein
MHEVEVRLTGWKIADAMAELRRWLDHHQCTPVNFNLSRTKNRVLLVSVQFNEAEMAEAFRRHFGG